MPITATGTLLEPPPPLPSMPLVSLPQHCAVPAVVRPHVCVAPASIWAQIEPPETTTSVGASTEAPLPSCPEVPRPQQRPLLALETAHACSLPTLSQVWPDPSTLNGVGVDPAVNPSPRRPYWREPQQCT